jgi:threonine aldolase
MNITIDLRSDTVTNPGPDMRRAMADAEVGDDYYREDPSVAQLEAMAAERMGAESAMMLFSATQANLVALMAHTQRGDSVILDETCHIQNSESGHLGPVCGLTARLVRSEQAIIAPESLGAVAQARGEVLNAPTSLLCLENTHNAAGGIPVPPSAIALLRPEADRLNLAIHVDGSRIFNAAVALGVAPADLFHDADSLTICLTKGLTCPVGALLVGGRDFIQQARRWRQMVGGGMRQGGVIAAAGSYALDHMVDRLADDHATARHFHQRLTSLGLDFGGVEPTTNMIYCRLPEKVGNGKAFVEALGKAGVLVNPPGDDGGRLRFVTHDPLTTADMDRATDTIGRVLDQTAKAA